MIGIFLLGALAAFLAWTWYYKKNWAKRLTADISFESDYVYAGNQTTIAEIVENHKRMPVPVLEVAFHIHKGIRFLELENTAVSDFTYKRDVFSMLGEQRITRKLAVVCHDRGYYHIEKADFTAYSTFHTAMYTMTKPVETSLYVYARRTDVSELMLCCEKMLGTRQCARRLYEDPFAFRGIREYTVTDPMKTINWKASAKSGEWMVNTFDSTLTEQVMIYLNVVEEGIIRHENLIEEGISVAASLAQKLIGKGMEVGIAVNVEGEGYWMPPAGGRVHLTIIERMLAELPPKGPFVPYRSILTELPGDAMPVFISRDVDEAGVAMAELLGRETEGIWVLPATATELRDTRAGERRTAQIRETGSRLRVLVRKVEGV